MLKETSQRKSRQCPERNPNIAEYQTSPRPKDVPPSNLHNFPRDEEEHDLRNLSGHENQGRIPAITFYPGFELSPVGQQLPHERPPEYKEEDQAGENDATHSQLERVANVGVRIERTVGWAHEREVFLPRSTGFLCLVLKPAVSPFFAAVQSHPPTADAYRTEVLGSILKTHGGLACFDTPAKYSATSSCNWPSSHFTRPARTVTIQGTSAVPPL